MKIAYLGPKGSFSHHVVQTAFPQEELQAFATVSYTHLLDVFLLV